MKYSLRGILQFMVIQWKTDMFSLIKYQVIKITKLMKIDINKNDLSLLFVRAKKGFEGCIKEKDNHFLQDEISIPLDDILLLEDEINIVFKPNITHEYLIYVNLLLCENNTMIGRYKLLIHSEEGEIDDFLTFY